MLCCQNNVLFVYIIGIFGVKCMWFLVFLGGLSSDVFDISSGFGILALYGNLGTCVETFL